MFLNTGTTVSRKLAREVVGVNDHLYEVIQPRVAILKVRNAVEGSQIAMVKVWTGGEQAARLMADYGEEWRTAGSRDTERKTFCEK